MRKQRRGIEWYAEGIKSDIRRIKIPIILPLLVLIMVLERYLLKCLQPPIIWLPTVTDFNSIFVKFNFKYIYIHTSFFSSSRLVWKWSRSETAVALLFSQHSSQAAQPLTIQSACTEFPSFRVNLRFWKKLWFYFIRGMWRKMGNLKYYSLLWCSNGEKTAQRLRVSDGSLGLWFLLWRGTATSDGNMFQQFVCFLLCAY